MADEPTYHISIWDTPPTYLCQVCNQQGLSKAAVVTHLDTEHQLPPIPTILAADYERGQSTLRERSMPSPTYYTTQEDDKTVYNCLICRQQGQEHHSADRTLFEQHQQQRHAGEMIEGEAPAAEDTEEEGDTPAPEQPPPEPESLSPETTGSER